MRRRWITHAQRMRALGAAAICMATAYAVHAQVVQWPMFRHDARRTGMGDSAAPVTGTLLWSYTACGAFESSPAVASDGTVYISSEDTMLYAVSPAGALLWSYDTHSGYSSPAVGMDGRVCVGSWNNRIYGLASAGALLWSYETLSNALSSPLMTVGGQIYSYSDEDVLYVLESTGALSWSYAAGPAGSEGSASASRSLFGVLYFGTPDNTIYALSSAGTLDWSYSTGGRIEGAPALTTQGVGYLGSCDDTLYAITSPGLLAWSYRTHGDVHSSPAIGPDGRVCVGSRDTRVYSFASNGVLSWSYEMGEGVMSSPAIGSDGAVCVGSGDYAVYVLDSGGALRWTYRTAGEVNSSPAIAADRTMYAASRDCVLYCFRDPTATPTPAPTETPAGTPTPTPLLDLRVSCDAPAVGEELLVEVSVQPIVQAFDAWAVVFGPGGEVFSFDLADPSALIEGAVPLATGVPGLPALYAGVIFSMPAVPQGTEGEYRIVAGLVPAGTVPTGPEGAVPGYVDEQRVVIGAAAE